MEVQMKVIPDFKTDKFVKEFKKTFGRGVKPPKATMKLLVENLSKVVGGPATAVSGSPENGLIVKVMSSATGERIIHHIRLDENLSIIDHVRQKIGDPHSSATVGTDELSLRSRPRAATVAKDADVVGKRIHHSE